MRFEAAGPTVKVTEEWWFSMLHAEPHRDRPARPGSRAGAVGVCLVALGVALLLPSLLTNSDASSGLVAVGWACVMAGTVSALYAVAVKKDRSWLTLAGLVGIVFAMSPLGALVLVIAGVVIGMNLARSRSQPVPAPSPAVGRCPACGSDVPTGARYCGRCGEQQVAIEGNAGSRRPISPAVRLERGGALVGIVAAHVIAAAALFVLMFASGSGVLDLATLIGATTAFVGVWWRRSTHPYQAMLLAWLVPVAIVGVIVLADSLGLLGA